MTNRARILCSELARQALKAVHPPPIYQYQELTRFLAEIAKEYEVHPTQVSQWKTILLERLPEVFTSGPTAEVKQAEREVARLHEKVGELTMELDWLKKKSKQLGL